MQRVIEFRGIAERNGKKEWVYGFYLKSAARDGVESHYIALEDGSMYEIDPKTRGQYTGLSDRKGGMVFEGDIFEKTLHPRVYRKKKDKEGRFDVGETYDIHPGVLVRLKVVWDKKSCGFCCENIYVNPSGVRTGSTFIPGHEIAVGDLWPIEHFFNENRKMEIVGNVHDNPELQEDRP